LRAGDAGYPSQLADLDGSLPVLHGVGRLSAVTGLDHDATVTIVGARRASAYGLRIAERLARDLAAAGVTVVSGMAIGIDAAAHRGALAAGGTTVAVLANGPDVVYPARHGALYGRILASGAAVSEYRPGTTAKRWCFPARNRLMAALATVVVIVEAAQPSGSLITADEAARVGRTVGAVPGSVEARVAAGTNALLADGAHVIRDARDVLDLLFGVGAVAPGAGIGAGGSSSDRRLLGAALDRGLRDVLDLVETGSETVDAIAVGGAITPREAAIALARLELLGYVEVAPAGGFVRAQLRAPAPGSDLAPAADL
jgi:DNA processing protein